MSNTQKITINFMNLIFKGDITHKSYCITRCHMVDGQKYKVEVYINNSIHSKFMDCNIYSRKQLEDELDSVLFPTS